MSESLPLVPQEHRPQREAPYIGREPEASKRKKTSNEGVRLNFGTEMQHRLNSIANGDNTLKNKKHLLGVLGKQRDIFNKEGLTEDDFEVGMTYFLSFNAYIEEKLEEDIDEVEVNALKELQTKCRLYMKDISEKIEALQAPASPEALASLQEVGMASNSGPTPRAVEQPERTMSSGNRAKIEEAKRRRKEELSSAEEYISSVVEDVLRKTMSLEDFEGEQGNLTGPKHLIAKKIMDRIEGAEELHETSNTEQKKAILQRLDVLMEDIKNEIKKLGEIKPRDRTVESSLRSILDASIDTINAHKKKLEIENKPEKKREDKNKNKKEEETKYEIRNLSELEVLLSETLANPELTVTSTEREMIVAQVERVLQKSTLEEGEVDKILTIISDIYGGEMIKVDQRKIPVAGQKIKLGFRFNDKRSLVTTLYGIFYNKKTSIQRQKEFEKREKERNNPPVQEQHFSIHGSGSLLMFLEKIYSDPNIIISEQQKDSILQQTKNSIDKEFKLIQKTLTYTLVDLELRIDAINSLIDKTLEKPFLPKIRSEQDRTYTKKYENTASLLKGIRSILKEVQKRIDNTKAETETPATHVEAAQEVATTPPNPTETQNPSSSPELTPDFTPLTPEIILQEIITPSSESFNIPENIKQDNDFENWLHRIAEKKCRGDLYDPKYNDKKPIEEWYKEYTDTSKLILQIQELLANESAFDHVFAGFTNTEEKEFARKNMGKELEWQMYLNPEGTKRKIEYIFELIERLKNKNEEIAKLEKIKKELEDAQTQTTSMRRLSGEAAFDVVHPKNISRVADLTGFLNDIQENYAYYSNTGKNKNSVGYIRSMFSKYKDSRKKGIAGHVTSKIPWYKKLGYTISQYSPFGHELEDHEDVNSFERIINFLQSENLVPNEGISEEEASDNMHKLLAKLQQVKDILAKDPTETPEGAISELPSEDNSDTLKDKLKKLYNIYVENMGRQTSFQKNINSSSFNLAQSQKEKLLQTTKLGRDEGIVTRLNRTLQMSIDFSHFTQETRSMFALKKLSELNEEFKKAKQKTTPPNFRYFEARLQTIPVDEENSSPEVVLEYKKLSLEISQAYIALANKDKSGSSIADIKSMKHYRNILESDSVAEDEKKKYLRAAIKLLTESINDSTRPKNTFRKIELGRFIDFFQLQLDQLEQSTQ